jgi:methylated-DNA-[protein]-cysteine S-methyltransferase
MRILLPLELRSAKSRTGPALRGAGHRNNRKVTLFGRRLEAFLRGQPVTFDLELLALDTCGDFQRRVLLAEYGIPRGRVSTYGRIARKIGVPGGARAVGRALATNPFPLIIPCHRAVRSDGALGGFRGGMPMKRALLQMEGVRFSEGGRVVLNRAYY